jgi:uncharacterized membrane protein
MNTFLIALAMSCQAFDITSTAVALRDPRLMEGNPMLRGPQLYALKISVNVTALWAYKKDKRLKVALPLVLAGSGCLAGSLNVHTMNSLKK